MHSSETGQGKPAALALLSSERPRNVTWRQAAGLLFGDWGTSRLYVLGLAFLFAGRTSFYLILAMSVLIVAVGWAYTQICRIYPDGGGVYTAAKSRNRTLAVVGALLLFADYTVTASLSALDAFHYFGLPIKHEAQVDKEVASLAPTKTTDAGDALVLEHEDAFEQKIAALPAGVELPEPKAGEKKTKFWYGPDDHALKFVGVMTQDQLTGYEKMSPEASWQTAIKQLYEKSQPERLFAIDSPGLWAIVAIALIGLFNLMGPKHTGGFALAAAVGMVLITVLIAGCAIPQLHWSTIKFGTLHHDPAGMWIAFVSIVLALSGVEAIANLTGVMKKPVSHTASKAIWVVTAEVAIFNVILALCVLAIFPLDRAAHYSDMLAYLAGHYTNGFLHSWGEGTVRIIGGVLLLSAANTAIMDMISVQYLMARDGELPQFMQKLNRFGVPWMPAVVAASVPILVLAISHDLERLAALYAIGVIGAVAINVTLCAFHPRLRRMRRKGPMMALGIILLAIWVTLACVKHEALLFVTVVMMIGLAARQATKMLATRKGPRLSLLRQAIAEQLTPEALGKKKFLIGTYGSDTLAPAALWLAKEDDAALVVCFIREVSLSYKYEGQSALSIDSDLAAQKTFARFLHLAHQMKVPLIPVYDTGQNAAELLAENAAIHACERVLIGTSRQGAIYHLVKGHFQRRMEVLLPPEIPIQIVTADMVPDDVQASLTAMPAGGH